jgi:hypothetical protein
LGSVILIHLPSHYDPTTAGCLRQYFTRPCAQVQVNA